MLLGSLTTKVYEESGDFSIDAARLLYSPYRQYVGIHSPQKGEKALPTDKEVIYHLVSLDSQGKTMANTTINVSIYKLDWYWWWNGDANALARYVSNTYNRPIKHLNSVGVATKVPFTSSWQKTRKADIRREYNPISIGLKWKDVGIYLAARQPPS